jgi:hypothetical protein
MRLYRQCRLGDWQDMVEDVARALNAREWEDQQ